VFEGRDKNRERIAADTLRRLWIEDYINAMSKTTEGRFAPVNVPARPAS